MNLFPPDFLEEFKQFFHNAAPRAQAAAAAKAANDSPMGSEPWVIKLIEFIRTTGRRAPVAEDCGRKLGTPIICLAFGGVVGDMNAAEVGITMVTLTAAGSTQLPWSTWGHLRMHKCHRREIKVPAR